MAARVQTLHWQLMPTLGRDSTRDPGPAPGFLFLDSSELQQRIGLIHIDTEM